MTFGGGMTMQNGFACRVRLAVEVMLLFPECQPALLGFLRVVLLGEFGSHGFPLTA